jgi:hypothetical protein
MNENLAVFLYKVTDFLRKDYFMVIITIENDFRKLI